MSDPSPAAKAGTASTASSLAVARLVFTLVILIYIFLFSIALLGSAFKIFGAGFSETLIATTTNPVVGLMIGLLATSLIQSSSSTTSIVVGLVAAGALTVENAVPIVMGANMGTTVTNTLVAMASVGRRSEFVRAFAGATMHDFFNMMAILILFPLEQATHILQRSATGLATHLIGSASVEFHSPVKEAVKPAVTAVKHLLVDTIEMPTWTSGTIMLVIALMGIFVALAFLTKTLKALVLSRAEQVFTRNITRSGPAAMLLGVVITVSVQSSSITTSLLIPMIGAGIVPLEAAFAVTLGANVGTTVTALLASLTGNFAAVTVALVHLLFNLTGILLIYPVPAIRRIPVRLARWLAHGVSRRRYFALLYMGGVFFVMPLLFVFADKLLRSG